MLNSGFWEVSTFLQTTISSSKKIRIQVIPKASFFEAPIFSWFDDWGDNQFDFQNCFL